MTTLSVWHIKNPPAEPTWYPVSSPAEGYRVIQELATVDLRDETIICNALGLSVLEDGDMVDWHSEEGDDLDTWADKEGLDDLTTLREEIARAAPLVDTPAGRYAHNIVNVCLMQINLGHGRDAANEAVEDYGLEPLGWAKRVGPTDCPNCGYLMQCKPCLAKREPNPLCCPACGALLPCLCSEYAKKIVP